MTARVGLFGKLPARGDFVRSGLPGGFVTPWDAWLQAALAASQGQLGEGWLPAWLEAPVWRFAMSAGLCGPDAVLGTMLPSVDRVGRYFPLTLAVVFPPESPPGDWDAAEAWLDGAEAAGFAALEQDATQEQIVAMLPPPPAGLPPPTGGSHWWTGGGPRVAPTRLHRPALPNPEDFAAMLQDPILPLVVP